MEKQVIPMFILTDGTTIHIGVWPMVIPVAGSESPQVSTPLTLLINYHLHLMPYLTFENRSTQNFH